MTPARELPAELKELLAAGILRHVDQDEYSIDGLSHPERTWLGWVNISYSLRIEEDDDGHPLFEIVEETREHGDDSILCSEDPDEAVCWITEHVESKPT